MQDKGVMYLYNQSFWEINELEITNDAPSEGMRRGVEIAGEEFGTLRHIYLDNLHVHHIKGTVGNDYDVSKRTGGIFFMVWDNSVVPTRFDDVRIENCMIHDCANQGIVTFNKILGYPGSEIWMPRRITNMVIRHNTIHHITKNAMILRMMDGGVVEYNLCYTTATGITGNTIFTRSSRNVICQYNEGYDNRSPDNDGSLYDADLESPGCIFQYSYSHDNAHGLYWQCTVQQDSGIIVRYNISQNDKGRIFNFSYPSNGTQIYNNTVFIGSHRSPVIIGEKTINGGKRHYSFLNNLIVNLSNSARYVWVDEQYIGKREFSHNLFHGNHPATEPDDPFKITADPMLADPGTAGVGLETTGGYKLLSGSAAIDKGMAIPGNGGYDFWGNPLYNRNPDIGAHENEGTSTGFNTGSDNGGVPVESHSLKIKPNPLVIESSISFLLTREEFVSVEIYDSVGRKVKSLIRDRMSSGDHSFRWDGTGAEGNLLDNGLYICNLRYGADSRLVSRAIIINR
jgi:hypothetical protein